MDIRHTKSRQAVLRAVKLSPQALSAEQVLTRVKPWVPEANRATVYRNLDFLTRRGEIYRVDSQDGIKRFIGHAFHSVQFTCQRCGQIRQLPSESLQEYVNRKMWGKQAVFFSRLNAHGLCGSCLTILRRQGVRT